MNHLFDIARLIAGRAHLHSDDRGASLVEYALLLALIAVVCIGAVTYFGTATSTSFSTSNSSMFTPN